MLTFLPTGRRLKWVLRKLNNYLLNRRDFVFGEAFVRKLERQLVLKFFQIRFPRTSGITEIHLEF